MRGRRAPLTAIVLAAGQGTRLRSKTGKLLHAVAGRALVEHVVDTVCGLRPARTVVVVGHEAERVQGVLAGRDIVFATQTRQLGTGHAVLRAARWLRGRDAGTVLIVSGDVPALLPSTLRRLVRHHRRSRATLTVLTAEVDDATGYGRIVRDERGRLRSIVEQRDADARTRAIREINCGIYCASGGPLLRALERTRRANAQREYYLTDAVHLLAAEGARVEAVLHDDAAEALGVNTRAELAAAARTLYARKADELQRRGVTLLDADRTWIDPRARVGRDSVIFPDVIVDGATTIGEDCRIYPGCRLADCRIGRGVHVLDHSIAVECRIAEGARIGPFAHLRPGSVLGPDTRVGNFVELKQARLGRGAKASHLTYLGDARVGAGCNIGAGTITCNYDGHSKHETVLADGVFVGSNSQLVAPVTIGRGAYVAAGSTVTEDVPAFALAIARSRQRNIPGWARKRRSG